MDLHSVLIANRGEIAVRVIRACHRMGLHAVAVYSDADRDAPFVEMADAAVHIGGAPAADSYLNADALIDAARRAGADAVHPGYGFLAENAAFAGACADTGLTFVGPVADTIARMGSKIAAKAAAEAAGVPVVPGYHGEDQSDEILTVEAARIGVPLMIKASAGGGGRGMRRVDDLDGFAQALEMARREAGAAFGDAAVLLEKYVASVRHIEVQVLADHHGTVLHLFERDCSAQRNHQKVIEEAPAPNLLGDTRKALLEHAVALAAGIGYRGAGTVEYILDADSGEFHFLEMNTRLQVEHPVTEAITGLDLVEWQLRVAGGEALPFAQEEIRCDGWAIEARVAAEDPAKRFLPRTGAVTVYREPAIDGLRIDSGLRQGSVVTHHYDSMLAKVIAGGRDRRSALRALRRGLARFRIGGVGVNTAFLLDLLQQPDFVAGTHDTGLIPAAWPGGWTAPGLSARHRAEAVLAKHLREGGDGSPWRSLGAWRVTEPAGRSGACLFHLREPRGGLIDARVEGRGGDFRVVLDGDTEFAVEGARLENGGLIYEEDGLRRSIDLDIAGATVTLHTDGGSMDVEVLRPEQAMRGRVDPETEGQDVRAPMPGRVAEVLVAPGETVTAVQPVIVLEAMKLLQRLAAPCAGQVCEIPHTAGETVDGGALLVALTTGNET